MDAEGLAHLEAGRFDAAQAAAEARLAAHPDDGPALHVLGVASWRLGQQARAIEVMNRALTHLGQSEEAATCLRNLTEMCRVAGRLDEAAAHGANAVALGPADPNAWYNLGIVEQERMRLSASIAALRQALALAPDHAGAHFELAEALLLSGQFKEGWEEYEWRFRMPQIPRLMPPTSAPQWDGAPMPGGRLLLIADQGFGDVIQFMRFLPWAKGRCADLVIACSSEMQPLVAPMAGGAPMFRDWATAPPFDAYVAFSGLPRLFGVDLTNIPAGGAYVHPDPERLARWRAKLDALAPRGSRRIGLVWAGRPTPRQRPQPLARA